MSGFLQIVKRDLLLSSRRRTDLLTPLFFFVIVVSLFPLGIGPEPETLRTIAPGVVWVAALLATMLSLGRMFADDHADGTLEQMLIAPVSLPVTVLGKIFAHWLGYGVPLVLVAPILGLQMGLAGEDIKLLMVSLLLGTPALSLIGSLGAALTLGVRGSSVLVALLVLPLYIPVLIFGAGAVDAATNGQGADAHLSLLGAILIVAAGFVPWGTAAALRISLD